MAIKISVFWSDNAVMYMVWDKLLDVSNVNKWMKWEDGGEEKLIFHNQIVWTGIEAELNTWMKEYGYTWFIYCLEMIKAPLQYFWWYDKDNAKNKQYLH